MAARSVTGADARLCLQGELVHLEDLVPHDAEMDQREPTYEVTRAYGGCRPVPHRRGRARLGHEVLRPCADQARAHSDLACESTLASCPSQGLSDKIWI